MDINVTIKCPDLPLAAAALAKAIAALSAPYPAHPAFVSRDNTAPAAPNAATEVNLTTPEVPVNPIPGTQTANSPAADEPIARLSNSAQTAPSAVPITQAPQITGDMVAKAGADLIAANPAAMAQLNALLQKYSVGCAQELQPDQIGPFATEMRALGARI